MRRDLADALAVTFLDGPWDRTSLISRGAVVTGRPQLWLATLVGQLLAQPRPPSDRPRELAALVQLLPAARFAGGRRPAGGRVGAATRVVANPWGLPDLDDLGALRELLDLTEGELAWFSDPGHWARREGRPALLHYQASTRVAPSGAVRVLEAPKPRLKALQRRLLREVLQLVPPHDAAHGFRLGRSIETYAAPHAGKRTVVHLDLEGFFASVTVDRVHGILRTAGLPERVAHAVAGLTTTVLPLRTWRSVARPSDPALHEAHWRLGRRLAAPHLPQGAHLAAAGQPRGAPPGRTAHGSRRGVGRELHEVRRRPRAQR